jgi:hypothetical protein
LALPEIEDSYSSNEDNCSVSISFPPYDPPIFSPEYAHPLPPSTEPELEVEGLEIEGLEVDGLDVDGF